IQPAEVAPAKQVPSTPIVYLWPHHERRGSVGRSRLACLARSYLPVFAEPCITTGEFTRIKDRYPTVEQLWAKLSPDFAAGVASVAGEVGLDAKRLQVLLVGR